MTIHSKLSQNYRPSPYYDRTKVVIKISQIIFFSFINNLKIDLNEGKIYPHNFLFFRKDCQEIFK
ncbi:hypothetical protein BpHYR1_042633 [Brachionus plicatilis]|uniref:Uncharacterized protein n=1 Tax=Brachionus plicatilis TaxID=10195 RepID=A0A3M7T7S4_BRAPC|nr:hypothetical protein BpHYR1_042633 [Brachionus plicatilis]